MEAINLILVVHIISGFTSLLCGLLAMIFNKGRKGHTRSGRVYYFGMLGVFLTASLMFMIEGNRLLFLFLVGVFSFYLVHIGARAIKIKNLAKNVKITDWLFILAALCAGLVMIGLSFNNGVLSGGLLGVLLICFGLLTVLFAAQDVRYFTRLRTSRVKIERSIILHVVRMGGGYIATVTAFLVTNVNFLPPMLVWILPGIIGGVIISRIKRGILKRKAARTQVSI